MKETEITTNRAETLKQQSRETAPVVVVCDVPFFVRQLPNVQSDFPQRDCYDMSEAPQLWGAFEGGVAKPHRGHIVRSGACRYDQCGPELVGTVEHAHDLVRAARRPHTGIFSAKNVDGGGM